jgi:putative ABC transport system permease protein
MTTLLFDIRYALRVLFRRRTFSASAISILALAIGANVAIFALVADTLLARLPLPSPERLVRIEERHHGARANLTGAAYSDLRDRSRSFEGIAVYRLTSPGLSAGTMPQQVIAAEVSPDYMRVLGVPASTGRTFDARDFAQGGTAVTILSYGTWRSQFGGDPGVIGRRVLVNAVPTEVVGVMPSGFFAPGTPAIWLPQPGDSPLLRNRRAHLYTTVARLRDAASLPQGSAELAALADWMTRESGGVDPDLSFVVTPLRDRLVQSARPAVLLLWGAVAVLLLTAGANVANLMLMQGHTRSRELSIRTALGAGRVRLLRQLTTESMMIAAAAGTVGTIAGAWTAPVLRSLLPVGTPPQLTTGASAFSWRILLFALAVSVASAVLFGLAPALRGSFAPRADVLRGRTATPAHARLRSFFVGFQVALTMALLVAAGLLARSFASVTRIDPGFDASGVVAFDLTLPPVRYPDAGAQGAFLTRVVERLRAVPGIDGAAATGALPMTGTPATSMAPEGRGRDAQLSADVVTATPDYFATLRIPVRAGRVFSALDSRGALPVMVISEEAAHQFWPDGTNPLGRTVIMRDWGTPYAASVVGVVGNIHQAAPDVHVVPAVYYPVAQFPETLLRNSLVVRTAASLEQIVPAVRAQVALEDRDQPLAAIRPLTAVLDASIAGRRTNLLLTTVFAAFALLLAVVGVYGVVAFAVAQRTREIAVRVALGAERRHIAAVTLAQGAVPVGIGIAVGAGAARVGSRAIASLLFGVSGADAVTLLAIGAIVAVAGIAACAPPLRRALRIDPAAALREEA